MAKKHAVPNVYKTDGYVMLKRLFQFPAQPSPFSGTMENSLFAYLTKKYKYLKSDFCTIIKSCSSYTTERTKVGTFLC